MQPVQRGYISIEYIRRVLFAAGILGPGPHDVGAVLLASLKRTGGQRVAADTWFGCLRRPAAGAGLWRGERERGEGRRGLRGP